MTSVEKPPSDYKQIADVLREIGDKNRSALFDPENLKGLAILKLRARAAFEDLMDHWRGLGYDVRGLRGEVSKTAKALELDDGQDDDPGAVREVVGIESWRSLRGVQPRIIRPCGAGKETTP